MKRIPAEWLVAGDAAGKLCLLTKPLSLWGGCDISKGTIVDATHPQRGLKITGHVLAMTEARGSSSSSSALAEAARCGSAPAAIVLTRLDPILVIGSLVAQDLYGVVIPIALISLQAWPLLTMGANVRLAMQSAEVIIEQAG